MTIIRFTKGDLFFVAVSLFCVFVTGLASGLGWNFIEAEQELLRNMKSLEETSAFEP